jgi:hypothetical protein
VSARTWLQFVPKSTGYDDLHATIDRLCRA